MTDSLEDAADLKLAAAERAKRREARRNRLATACQAERANRRCEVVTFYGGARERLVSYDVLRDVRLVHAPEEALANFGGDADNFEWPRHAADYSFLRAYTAPDGTARAFDRANVPYHPDVFLGLALDGYRDGTFVMILGYPARTDRFLPAALLAGEVERELPAQLDVIRSATHVLARHAGAGGDVRLHLADRLENVSNTEKALSGRLEGLLRVDAVKARRAQERELAAWIAADPARSAKDGGLLPSIERLAAAAARGAARRQAMRALQRIPQSMTWAAELAERSLEREKPDDERRPGFHDREDAAFEAEVLEDPTVLVPAAEEDLLSELVRRALALPKTERIDAVDRRALGRTGSPGEVARAIAHDLVAGTRIGDPAARTAYAAMKPGALAASPDPLVAFACELLRQARPFEERREREVTAPLDDAVRRYTRLRLDWRGADLYPDANGTERFTWGEVSGYMPYPRGSRRGDLDLREARREPGGRAGPDAGARGRRPGARGAVALRAHHDGRAGQGRARLGRATAAPALRP